MSYNGSRDEGSESEFATHGAPSQLLSPSQTHGGGTTRYSASLSGDSAHSLIESSSNDNDSVASIDVDRVGFTPRTSVAISESDQGQDDDTQHQHQHPQQQQQQQHPYAFSHDPYGRRLPYRHANESIDDEEQDVEQMLFSEPGDRSVQYDDQDDYVDVGSEEYQGSNGEGSILSGDEELGVWPHPIYSVEEILGRRTRPLSDILEVRSSVGSRSQASGMLSRPMSGNFSPGQDAPPVPMIPAHFRQQTEPAPPSPQPSIEEQRQVQPSTSRTSLHSRASTDPGVRPVSTASSRVRDRIALFEERSTSPALVHGARPGSPSGTHALGLGLGLTLGRPPSFPPGPVTPSASAFPQPPTTMLSPGASSMLSTPFSPEQSMPSMSPTHYRDNRDRGGPESATPYSRQDVSMTTSPRYQSSIVSSSSSGSGSGSGVMVGRPESPSKSIKSYHSSEASSIHIPSYASSPHVHPTSRPASENIGLRATSALIQSVSDDILARHLQHEEQRGQSVHSRDREQSLHEQRSTSPLTTQPQTGYVQRILQSLRPVEQEAGLFRRQSLRRASGGAPPPQERSASGRERSGSQTGSGGGGSGGRERAGSTGSGPAPGSRGSGGAPGSGRGSQPPRSEGEGASLRGSGESFEGVGVPGNEEPLRVGTLWYLHVHTGDEHFRWIKCKAVLFSSQLQLTWVEAGGGKAIIGLDLLNCHEVRSVPSPTHASARDDIGNVAARRQAEEEGPESRIAELAPFQMLYEDGVERLGAGSPRERVRWVAAIWDALNRAAVAPSRSSSPAPSIGTIPSQHSSQRSASSSSRAGSASTVFIPPETDIPDIGSTISSLTRSSFRSAPRSSSYHSPSYVTGSLGTPSYHPRPRSVDDSSIMSPDVGRIAITPSRSSSLRRTSSMTDLDEYASAVAPSETGPSFTGTRTRTHRSHSGSETSYLSQSQFDVPFLPSRGAPSEMSLGVPRTIQSRAPTDDESSIRSSPARPLPALPRVESLPSISSMESLGRYDTATGTISGTATGTATGRRYDTASSAGVRSGGTAVPRPLSATGTATSFLTAPAPSIPGRRTSTPTATVQPAATSATPAASPSPVDSQGNVIYSPADSGPTRRIRANKASSIYSLSSVNEQERHRQAAEDSSTVDEYGSMMSSPAPSLSAFSASPRPTTPTRLVGTTVLPRLSYRGPESASLLGDSHATGSPAAPGGPPSSSSSSSGSVPSRSYATPRTPSRLSKIVEMPTGASATSSLVRSIPGARPRSARFLAAKSQGSTQLSPSSEELSSDEWQTASEKTPTKSSGSRSAGSSVPATLQEYELAVEPEDEEDEESERSAEEVASMQTNGSEGDDDAGQGARLARQDSYFTSTSAGLRRERSIGGDTYSDFAIDVCLSDDISELTPLSGSSEFTRTPQATTPIQLPATTPQQPVSVFSSPYYTADEAPSTPVSFIGSGSIPTIRTDSASASPDVRSSYATPIEPVDTSSEYSTAMRWPSSSEYSTAPPASSSRRTPTVTPTPSVSVPVGASSSRHTPSVSPTPSVSVPVGASSIRHTPTISPTASVSVPAGASPMRQTPHFTPTPTASVPAGASSVRHTPNWSPAPSVSVPAGGSSSRHTPTFSPAPSVSVPAGASSTRHTPTYSPSPSMSVPAGASSSRHTPTVSPTASFSIPIALSDPGRSPTPGSVASSISVARIATPAKRSPTPASVASSISLPRQLSPTKRSPTPASSERSASIPPFASPASYASRSVSGPSGSSPHVASVEGTPTPSVIPSIPDAESEMSVTSEEPSTESSVTPTQSRTMSLASRSVASSPMSTPRRESTPHSIAGHSTPLPKSTSVSSVSSLSSTTVSSISASPLPSPMSASSKSLSSITTSLRTPASFLMPPVPPPSSTRSTRSRPVSEASWAPSSASEESMASSLFDYTPSAASSILPPIEEYDSTIFQTPSRGSTASGQYEIILESTEGEPSASGGSTTPRAGVSSTMSIAMAETATPLRDSLSPSSLTRSESINSVSSLRSSIFLPSRSSSLRSVGPPESASSIGTPRSPTVSVTMTPAQSFHPSFRDDLSTVPSEEEEAMAVASAPMEIITHDVNRLLEYLDGVDRQRVAEHDDVKNQLDRLEDGLKRLADFVKEEADKPPVKIPSSPSTVYTQPMHWVAADLPEPTDDVVMHAPPPPAVILVDLPESPLKLSSGSVTESIQWLSSPSSMVTASLALAPSEVGESMTPSSLTKTSSLRPSDSASQRSASIHPSESIALHPSQHPSDHSGSIHPSESIALHLSQAASEHSGSIHPSESIALHPSRAASMQSPSIHPSESIALHPSRAASSISGSIHPSDTASLHPSRSESLLSPSLRSSKSPSLRPSDSASQHSPSIHPSESLPMSPASDSSTVKDVRSVDGESEAGRLSSRSEISIDVFSVASDAESTPDSLTVPGAPPPSTGSTPPPSIPGGSRPQTPLDTPPRTRGNTPDISIVSASGRGSPARSDITVRAAVSNAQLRDMLNDLRNQTDRLMDQQNRANEAIEELQNRPPVQLPPLPATPRRSPYADLLSQIADTLRNIVDAGEAARNLPETESDTESIMTTDTEGTIRLNDLQNRLHGVLDMPVPPRSIPSGPEMTMGDAAKEPSESGQSSRSSRSTRSASPSHVSLLEQHVADFPRIRRPKPRRAFQRSPSPTIITRPGTAPIPGGPMWGRPQTIYATPIMPRQRLEEPHEEPEQELQDRPASGDSGSTVDLLRELQRRRRDRRGGDGTFIPGGDEVVEEIPEPLPRPDTAPIEFLVPEEPVTRTWYSKRPKSQKPPPMTFGDEGHEPSEPPSPPRSPIVIPQEPRQPPRPTIPLGELPSTASYAEMLALLRQNELMQRHQNEQQNELVRYLHDLNGWLARDVNNRQMELQGVEDRIAHLQNALAARPQPQPQPYYVVPEQEPVMPLPPRMAYPPPQPRVFGDPEGDDGIIPRFARMPYPPPGPVYAPPPMAGYPGYPGYPPRNFGEPGSPAIIPPSRHQSRMPVIEIVGGGQQPGRSGRFRSPSPQRQPPTAPPVTVPDPTRAGSPSRPSQPATTVPNITINIPESRSRRSPSLRDDRDPRSRRPDSRSPTRRYSRAGSRSPVIIPTASRTSRRRSRSPSPERLIVAGDPSRPPRSSRRGRSRAHSTVVVGDHRSRSRSHSRSPSRTPSPIVIPASGVSSSRRPRSERRQIIVQQGDSLRSRSRSRSRSAERVIIAPPTHRSRRSRSPPRTIIVPPPPSRGRSRSRSSPRTMVLPSQHHRRSRSPPRTVVLPTQHRSSRRSRSPPPIIMPDSRRHSRSRSPRQIIVPADRSRSRSRSPTRRRLVKFPSRSRSRSPIVLAGPSHRSRRSRSRSPVTVRRRSRSRTPPIIVTGRSEHSPRRSPRREPVYLPSTEHHQPPIIVDESGRRSRGGLFSRLWPRSRRTSSPTRVLGKRRSRSPQVIVAGDPRRSRSRSRSPRRHAITRRSRSRTPPVIVTGSRRDRSPRSRRYRSRSRSPRSPHFVEHRSRSRSPRSPRHRRRDSPRRYSPTEFDRGNRRPRSRDHSPGRRVHRGSRSPRTRSPRDREPRTHSPRSNRPRSYSPRSRRPHSYSPTSRRPRSYSPRESPRRSRSMSRRHGSRFGSYEPEEYDRGTTRRGSRRGSPRESPRRLSRRGGSPRDSRYGPEEYDRGTTRGPSRRTGSPEPSRRLRERPGRSRLDPDELDAGTPRTARPDSRRLTGITISPRSRLTRRSRSPTPEEEEEEGGHAPRTHRSDRHSDRHSPITVRIPEEEEFAPSRPATRRGADALSTIHEGDSIRTGSPSVIQVPGTGRRRTPTIRVASPPIRSASPSIIQLPSGDILRRATPQMLRVTTPRAEAPLPAAPTIIRVPSAPPITPRTQVLRIGTPRVAETVQHRRSPTPERRSRTPPGPTLITLPGHRPEPTRSQTIRVGGTPVPIPIPMHSPPPVEHPAPAPSIIQLAGQAREPHRAQTIRVGTPAQPVVERPPTTPSIIQLPGQARGPHRSQTIRVGTPLERERERPAERSPKSPTIIQLPGRSRSPHRSQTIRVGTPLDSISERPTSPSIIQLPGQAREPHRGQTIRVGTPSERLSERPPTSPSIIQLPGLAREPHRGQTIRVGTPLDRISERSPPSPSIIQLPGQAREPHRAQTIRVGTPLDRPTSPSIIQLPGQAREPHRGQTIRVGTPSERLSERPPTSPSIIQLPGQAREPHRAQTIRVGTPLDRISEKSPTSPSIIQLPSYGREPHRSQTIRVGTPLDRISERSPPSPSIIQLPGQAREPQRSQTIRVGTPAQPVIERPPTTPSIIQLPGQAREPQRSQTIRVGAPAVQEPVERPPTTPAIIQLPGQPREPHRAQTIRVGTPMRQDFAPTPAPAPGPSIIQLPGGGMSYGPQTVRVASPTPSMPEPTIIRLPEHDEHRGPTRAHTLRVGSPPLTAIPPSVIQLPTGQAPPERPPTSQFVRVGGATRAPTPVREPSSPRWVQPAEHIIRLPSTPGPQPPATPAFLRVGGRLVETSRAPSPVFPPPTMIQLPGTARPDALRSPTVRVTAPSFTTPATPSMAPPGPTVIRLPGSPAPTGTHAFVRVPEGAPGGYTEVPATATTPGGVVRVEHRDRTPTVIQVASPGPASRFVRATPSPGVPGFVRARGVATPGLRGIPEVVHVGDHTPVPGASRTSFDRPHSEQYPEHRISSVGSVDRDNIIAPVASRTSFAGQSVADTLERIAREADEEAEHRRRRRGAAGAHTDYQDEEARRQRQFEEFLEAQRQENERLRETLFQMAPGMRRSSGAADVPSEDINHIVTGVADTIKSARDADRASLMSLHDAELRRDLDTERARVRELEAELATMREQLEQERSQREVNVQDKCADMHDAVNNNHQEVRAQLDDLTGRMMECQNKFNQQDEMEEQKRAEKEARRAEKDAQQHQLQQLLEKMLADQEEERRLAEEERRRAAERMGLEQVIEELRQQNQEQQRLLVALLDEHRQANMQSSEATIQAVREAVAQHVPMDIKGHLNEFSKSLAEEVRLLLREVGKLREEKRNIQYEIGCMLCLKSKYGPGGEFDPEWRPATGPYTNGPPMPDAPGGEEPMQPPEDRPMTAPPAWRTIHQKKKPVRRNRDQSQSTAPPPMQMPSAPMPPPPVAPTPAPPPPPSAIHQHRPQPPYTPQPQYTPQPPPMPQPPHDQDRDRLQSWYAWQPDPNYAASSPSTAPLYEVPETRPLGFFGPRSPRDSGI